MNGYGNVAWVILILILIWLGVLIFTYINIYKRKDLSFLAKLIWIMVIFAAPVVGLVVYLVLGRQVLKKQQV